MGTPSATQYFEAIHTSNTAPLDPNLFTAAELVAGSFDSAAVSAATSKAVSTVNAAAPDSTSISQANSRAVSAASVGSVADSKAVSGSTNVSVVDSKTTSGSVNTSKADSKAVSVATATPTLTVVANSQAVSVADSKAVSVSVNASTADSKAVSGSNIVPSGRTVSDLPTYVGNNALANVLDNSAGATITDGSTNARPALVLTDAITGLGFIPAGTYSVASNITLSGSYLFAKGAKLKPASGVTITFNGQITAELNQIFDMSAGGTIAIGTANDVEVNPIWFGADPTYANDSTTAFQKCFASGALRIFIPWGQYDIRGTITIPSARIQVRGVGIESALYFNPTAGSTPLFSCVSGDNQFFKNFQCNNNDSGLALASRKTLVDCFSFANANISALTFEEVYVSSFTRFAINLDSAQYLKIDRCRFTNMNAPSGSPAEVIRCTTFMNRAHITGCRFADNDKVIRIAGANVLAIRDCSFENDGLSSIVTKNHIIELSGSGVVFLFDGNYVEAPRPAINSAFLALTDSGVKSAHIRNSHFAGDFGGTTYTDIMLSLGPSRAVKVENCTFNEILTYFVQNSASYPTRVHGCCFTDAAGVLSTHNTIMALMSGTIELNNYETKALVDVPSLGASGSASAWSESSDIAVTGAQIGDQLEVRAEDIDSGKVVVRGRVRTAGQVRITWSNPTNAAIDLASSDWFIKLFKADPA